MLCSSCLIDRSKAFPFSVRAKCQGCNCELHNNPSTLISVDPYLTDLRYKLYRRIMKDEDAMSTIRIHVHNWPEESVVRYMSYVERIARGSAANEVYDRMTCPLLWSIKPVPNSGRKLFDRQWTITTLSAIAEVAKLDSVSPNNESGVGLGPIVVKSGGKIISLAPPMTIRSYYAFHSNIIKPVSLSLCNHYISVYAKKRGTSFHHFVTVTCSTVTIPNVSDADLNLKRNAQNRRVVCEC